MVIYALVDSIVAWQCPVCVVSQPCPDTVHGSCCVSDLHSLCCSFRLPVPLKCHTRQTKAPSGPCCSQIQVSSEFFKGTCLNWVVSLSFWLTLILLAAQR